MFMIDWCLLPQTLPYDLNTYFNTIIAFNLILCYNRMIIIDVICIILKINMQSALIMFIKNGDSIINILFNHGTKNQFILKELFNHNNYIVRILLIYYVPTYIL